MKMILMNFLLSTIFLLLGVAFFTLLERKFLSYSHYRVGPNKNGMMGLFQPFNDLMKLFNKIEFSLSNQFMIIFMISPFFMVTFSLMLWIFMFHWGFFSNMKFFFILMMCVNGISTFFFLFPGWSSGSFYSLLGSFRTSAQVISYEGIFFFFFFFFFFFSIDYNFFYMIKFNDMYKVSFFLNIFILMWIFSILAETNRTPMDFSEGESELVSGFNTEYGGGFFSMIFLSEYMNMMFFSFLTSMIMFKNYLMFLFFMIFYVWVRVSFPRMRYDKLMMLSWKSLMFFIMCSIILFLMIMIF